VSDSTLTAAVVAAAGGVGAFAGAAFSAWISQGAQRRTQRHEQQRRDAEVVGPVLDFLVDVDPMRLAINASPDADQQNEVLRTLQERRDALRASILVLAVGHPDPVMRGKSRELAVALYNASTSAFWAVRDLHEQRGRNMLDVSKGDHAAAQQLAEELLDESARYGEGRRRKSRGASP
jgi:hypothetical protein